MELPEKPAIRFQSGQIFTGRDHADAIRAAFQAEDDGLARLVGDYEEGFLTTQERFVSREEAYELAASAGVAPPGEMVGWFSSEHLGRLRDAGLIKRKGRLAREAELMRRKGWEDGDPPASGAEAILRAIIIEADNMLQDDSGLWLGDLTSSFGTPAARERLAELINEVERVAARLSASDPLQDLVSQARTEIEITSRSFGFKSAPPGAHALYK